MLVYTDSGDVLILWDCEQDGYRLIEDLVIQPNVFDDIDDAIAYVDDVYCIKGWKDIEEVL